MSRQEEYRPLNRAIAEGGEGSCEEEKDATQGSHIGTKNPPSPPIAPLRLHQQQQRKLFFVGCFGLALIVALLGFGSSILRGVGPKKQQSQHDEQESSSLSYMEHLMADPKPLIIIYGTSRKGQETERYVYEAIHAGFRFLDTAGYPTVYNESAVGQAWTRAANDLGLKRTDFVLQTKYTPNQQDEPRPYNPQSSLEDQVRQSLAASLTNLQTSYVDILLLHKPLETQEETIRVWRTMEELVDQRKVGRIGVSNFYELPQLVDLYETARIQPSVLQNPFWSKNQFDTELRAFCEQHSLWYEAFQVIKANIEQLEDNPHIQELAAARNLTTADYLYAFVLSLGRNGGVFPLSGTTNTLHMAQDVELMERMQRGEAIFETQDELQQMAQLLGVPDDL